MIGIVILNYKTPNDVPPCIDSIRKTVKSDYRVYVVDNASPDGSFETLSKQFENAHDTVILSSGKNGGFSFGNNYGFRQAAKDGCELILSTNSDVLFRDGAIAEMANRCLSDPDCAVVGPAVFLPDGDYQRCNRGILTADIFVFRRHGFRRFDRKGLCDRYEYADYDFQDELTLSGMVSGCCFLIRTSVLEEIGYLDEFPFLYHEEDILGAQLRALRKKVVLDPKAEIVHWGGKSTGGISPFVRFHTMRSGIYYLHRYSPSTKRRVKRAARIVSLLFFVTALRHKEYRPYYKQLKQEIRAILKMKKAAL